MHTFVVIPCLNEDRLIEKTAQSLGFGANKIAPNDTTLVLVDNGSTDDTWATISTVKNLTQPRAVIIARENERGYVPPRHRGVLIALECALNLRLPPDEVLVLQGDADTLYEPGYVEAMRSAAIAAGPNHLVEGGTRPPQRFLEEHPGFQELADLVDAEMAPRFVSEADDVVADDKVAGYRLSDYFTWGGHRREFMSTGAEVHAETTRLFIRARKHNARKVHADEALALPSRRKIESEPIRHFATAGFPREDAWWRAWSASYTGPRDLGAFEKPDREIALRSAIEMRRAHLGAVFATLPTLVAKGLVARPPGATSDETAALQSLAEGQLGLLFEMLLPRATHST